MHACHWQQKSSRSIAHDIDVADWNSISSCCCYCYHYWTNRRGGWPLRRVVSNLEQRPSVCLVSKPQGALCQLAGSTHSRSLGLPNNGRIAPTVGFSNSKLPSIRSAVAADMRASAQGGELRCILPLHLPSFLSLFGACRRRQPASITKSDVAVGISFHNSLAKVPLLRACAELLSRRKIRWHPLVDALAGEARCLDLDQVRTSSNGNILPLSSTSNRYYLVSTLLVLCA